MILVPGGAGFSPTAWTSGAFSLPGRIVRGDAEMWGVDCFFVDFFLAVFAFLAVMGEVSKFGDEFVRAVRVGASREKPYYANCEN